MAQIIVEGRASLLSFICGSTICFVPLFRYLGRIPENIVEHYLPVLLGIYSVFIFALWRLIYRRYWTLWQVSSRAAFLGLVFGCGLILTFSDTTWTHFGWYLVALSFFHWSEYFTTAVTNPFSLQLDSYLLDHSPEYKLAALASWVEFTVEWYFLPGLKQLKWVSVFGLLIVMGGETLRKAAMITAKTNFNHYVQHVKEEGHVLVTRGVYSKFRHPSYVGWFYWSIGTQIILCNPICLVGYTVTSWKFFRERIEVEEITLLNFFGEEYLNYQRQVKTGLPFIKGYRMEL
ncbi:protein-S-isoprenylcysteine O-methyltransferase [Lingula anatina]|uniref:Protein-S-isoprenylcysteine O-methyltransferase n=1 Tax=Lingula anatina TaxID=7574 RepID=A0A1S3JQC1_LINAN|nr:protein-S-isoprenylcysteine O-methyltransferase [Lingula anatina]|eukprot:XP_013412159.1 protein-S-isoprenylcysteine O-methyltransferase [Lingula anatina]